MILSNLPGLSNAASRSSGRFVAAITFTSSRLSKPSISERSCISVLCTSRSPDVETSSLFEPIESISSMKMMEGDFCLAISNSSLTILPPSPMYFWASSAPTRPRKVAFVELATAFASMVLPVPGGPVKRTPLGGSIPMSENACGFSNGSSIASLSSLICASKPPIEE